MNPIKAHVYNYWSANPGPATAPSLTAFLAPDVRWRGPYPFDDITGTDALAEQFWEPLHASFTGLHRRTDLFMGGECEGEQWVSSHGYFVGIFARDWLGIPATGRRAFLRFGEFCRVEGGRITQIYTLLDIVDLAAQAGVALLPSSRGIAGFVPPPRTADGLLLADQPQVESQTTFQMAYDMLFGGLNKFAGDTAAESETESMGLARYWHPDMHWYGPAGIGTTRDMIEFQKWHQFPWLEAFPDRQVIWESPMFGDGDYAATAGWKEVIATHTGPYLGFEPSGKVLEFRIMDWWRRDGDKLAENWVLIDLLDMVRQIGADPFAALK
ncbi:MAG: ester cyclase [Chloroflexota bacterium]